MLLRGEVVVLQAVGHLEGHSYLVNISAMRIQRDSSVANRPSPTCKTYSGPSRCCRTLLVSIDGTVMPLAVVVIGAPLGYLGGGGRTLIVRKIAVSVEHRSTANHCSGPLGPTYNMTHAWRR